MFNRPGVASPEAPEVIDFCRFLLFGGRRIRPAAKNFLGNLKAFTDVVM
jgi:hypothetical protein